MGAKRVNVLYEKVWTRNVRMMRGMYEDSETMVMSAVGIIPKFTVGGIIPGKCSELLVCKVLVD